MARGPSPFRQVDVTRALKGALAAGIKVLWVEIDKNGSIRVVIGEHQSSPPNKGSDLDEWMKGHAGKA